MKYLIDGSSRKAIRKGPFVAASGSDGEFVWNTETVADAEAVTVAVCKAVAEANGVVLKKSYKRDEIITHVNAGLDKLEGLPEQNKPPVSKVIKDVVTRCAETRDASEDSDSFEIEVLTEVIQELRSHKIDFKIKSIGGMVKKEILEQGLVLTSSARKEQANKILSDEDFNPEEWKDVEEMRDRLVQEVQDTTSSQAMSIIRRFCKDGEIAMPKRTKEKAKPFRDQMIDFLIENSPATEEQLKTFLASKEKESSLGTAQKLQKVVDLAFEAGVASMSDPDEDEEKAAA